MYYLFGLVGLAAFWILSLWLSMDFIFFSFLSTQGTFDGDGHLFSVFGHFSSVLVALHRRFGGKGLHSNTLLYLWMLLVSDL